MIRKTSPKTTGNQHRRHIAAMVKIAITPAVFAATLSASVNVENKRALYGDVFVWLDYATDGVTSRMEFLRSDEGNPNVSSFMSIAVRLSQP